MNNQWKKVFKSDIKEKMKHSRQEFEMYKKTGYIIYLQQASNKLFSAVENYLMVKYERRVRSFSELKRLIGDNRNDKKLLFDASQIHYFFYNGELQMTRDEASFYYRDIYQRMQKRLQNI